MDYSVPSTFPSPNSHSPHSPPHYTRCYSTSSLTSSPSPSSPASLSETYSPAHASPSPSSPLHPSHTPPSILATLLRPDLPGANSTSRWRKDIVPGMGRQRNKRIPDSAMWSPAARQQSRGYLCSEVPARRYGVSSGARVEFWDHRWA